MRTSNEKSIGYGAVTQNGASNNYLTSEPQTNHWNFNKLCNFFCSCSCFPWNKQKTEAEAEEEKLIYLSPEESTYKATSSSP
jgi:hypothetical protein